MLGLGRIMNGNINIRFYKEFFSKNGMGKAKEISLISFKYDVIELCLLLLNVEYTYTYIHTYKEYWSCP